MTLLSLLPPIFTAAELCHAELLQRLPGVRGIGQTNGGHGNDR